MATLLTYNNTIESIVKEVKKLSALEQKEALAQLRAARILKEKKYSFVKTVKGLKPLTMAQIDKIKHESRKTI